MHRWPGLADGALGAGLALSALGLLDPRLSTSLAIGVAVALLGALRSRASWRGFAAALAVAYALAGWSQPEFRADTGSYFVYLRSLAFDGDLSFANDWELLDQTAQAGLRSPTGLVPNSQTLGPALLWAPFYGLAHAYVRLTAALGFGPWPADGTSEPYRRALALGTVAVALLGAGLLFRTLARRESFGPAALGVAAAVLGSPVLYYVLVAPGMAHGLAFGLAAILVHALARAGDAEAAAAPRAWLVVGAVLGLLVLVRTQAAVLVLVVLPAALVAWRRGRVALAPLAAAAGLGVLLFVPQMLAWKALFGRYLTVPQGSRYLDWSSPHLAEVLFSANHGLLTASPVLAVGLVGLLLVARRAPVFGFFALAACAALAWTNGAVADWDWEGGDAFGARRFDVAVPLLAAGLAAAAAGLQRLAVRRPLVLPAFVLGLLALWTTGFAAIFRSGSYPGAAPLDRLARDQALLVRRIATGVFGSVAGTRGRAAAYDSFSGEYLFGAIGGPDGTLRLAGADDRTLASGFSPASWREGGPAFRWALFPEACLNLPLRGDRALGALGLLARAPRRASPQTVTLEVNGAVHGTAELGPEWTTLGFAVSPAAFHAGENRVCLRFARGLPSGDDRPAAALAEVRLARRLEDLAAVSPAPPVDAGRDPVDP